MPPPQNLDRRRALADAAIDVLGGAGIHGLSHRTVDERSGLPAGTASNYFRSRDALLLAAADRVLELHKQDMAATAGGTAPPAGRETLIEMIALVLHHSATAQRVRYLAVYELMLEATRRPGLREALAKMEDLTLDFTVRMHRDLGLGTSRDQVRTLMTLFVAALFDLVTRPPGTVTPDDARTLVRVMVTGTLGPS
ncbi:TetR/AcrR family transcriptional regulator [Actinomadura sp. 7K507]|uniref:TetR/AcrR family transcriptional regulator n=1 Tax=Actinomadura sp. 7K507 TaxID=2530365 RepID=UPI00104FC5CC|nr:TetR/AcrR family transcriptional regulator [Actinomadura sp. 7K507]TDC95318.1 TetR/AcrR family transcriptional regulator [Actinomadura sp. 7K507]